MSSNQEVNRSNPFINRLIDIPLVKYLNQTIVSTYEKTKNSNRFITFTLDKAEGIAKYANHKAEPIKKLFDGPVAAVSNIADHQLQSIQRRFPIINSTPDEAEKYGRDLYEHSLVKRGVDGVSSVKQRSIDTLADYRDRLLNSAQAGQATINRYASAILNFTEGVIDEYVASPDSKKRPASTPASTYPQRLRRIAYKIADGSKYKATVGINKAIAIVAYGFDKADQLIKNTKSAVTSTIQGTISYTIQVRDSVLSGIATRTHAIKEKSDAAAVYVTKTLTNGVSDVTDRVVATATPHLPEGLQKPSVSFVQYIHHWQDRVDKATSTSDVLRAAADETKQNLRMARELFQSLLNNGDAQVKEKEKRW